MAVSSRRTPSTARAVAKFTPPQMANNKPVVTSGQRKLRTIFDRTKGPSTARLRAVFGVAVSASWATL